MYKPYFNIDNLYILKKLKLVLFPILHKGDWKSTTEAKVDLTQDFAPSQSDEIDLY